MRNRLPTVRKRYFVDEPVIVLPIAEYERLIQHLISMGLLDGLQENSRKGVLKRHGLLLAESKTNLRNAKRHYHIPVTNEDSAQ